LKKNYLKGLSLSQKKKFDGFMKDHTTITYDPIKSLSFPLSLSSNPHLLRELAKLGATALVETEAETTLALNSGFKDLIFTGMKYDQEHCIVNAMKVGAYLLIEKRDEVNRAIFLQQIAKIPGKVMFKLNEDDLQNPETVECLRLIKRDEKVVAELPTGGRSAKR
jgi:hypothetical protein